MALKGHSGKRCIVTKYSGCSRNEEFCDSITHYVIVYALVCLLLLSPELNLESCTFTCRLWLRRIAKVHVVF